MDQLNIHDLPKELLVIDDLDCSDTIRYVDRNSQSQLVPVFDSLYSFSEPVLQLHLSY